MQAITTKYHGPSNTRGSRISATSASGIRIYIPYPHELSGEEVHRKAAERLCEKLQWKGKLACGGTKEGYAFVFVE